MRINAKRWMAGLLGVIMIVAVTQAPVIAVDYDGHWAQPYIEEVSDKGWMANSDGDFQPDVAATRGEFVDALWRAAGRPGPEGSSPFFDVTVADPWYEAATSLAEQGVVTGNGNGLFKPNDSLTREMSFCIVARYLGLESSDQSVLNTFTDAGKVSDWARGEVAAMVDAGYVSGDGTTLNPGDVLSRGEIASLLNAIFIAPEHRIVCLAPSMVEVVYALGFGDSIVGWSQYTDYPIEVTKRDGWVPYETYQFESNEVELAKDVAVVSGFADYNAELVDALEPTLILAESSMQFGMYEELKEKGYNVVYSDPTSVEEVFDMMLTIGEALGVRGLAQRLVDGYLADIAEIRAITAELPKLKVYYEIAHQSEYGGVFYGPYTAGSGTPLDQMMEIAGGVNVFADREGGYADVTFEEVVATNPDVILSPIWPNAGEWEVTTIHEIMSREGFDETSAVKSSRVLYYDSSLFKRYGPRTITAIKKLAYILHPYYFENPANSVSPWELGRVDMFYPVPTPQR